MQPSPIIKSLHVYSPLPNAEAGDIGRPDGVGGGCDSEGAVSLATRLENLVNLLGLPFIRQGPLGWPRFEAPVVTAARETQRLGHPLYSEFGSMRFHKFEFSARGTEKMSTTFFNISRSSPTTASAQIGPNALDIPSTVNSDRCAFINSNFPRAVLRRCLLLFLIYPVLHQRPRALDGAWQTPPRTAATDPSLGRLPGHGAYFWEVDQSIRSKMITDSG